MKPRRIFDRTGGGGVYKSAGKGRWLVFGSRLGREYWVVRKDLGLREGESIYIPPSKKTLGKWKKKFSERENRRGRLYKFFVSERILGERAPPPSQTQENQQNRRKIGFRESSPLISQNAKYTNKNTI